MVGRNVEMSRREMLAALVAASSFSSLSAAADPLSSWNVGTLKGAIVEFVTEVTTRVAPSSCRRGADRRL
jgi:hypothetical protein